MEYGTWNVGKWSNGIWSDGVMEYWNDRITEYHGMME